MMSSLPFESLGPAFLTILAIMLLQVVLDHRRASLLSKHNDENFVNVLAAISCLSSKLNQKQLHEKQHRLEIRNKLKYMQNEIDTLKSALQSRPTENELFIRLHQNVLREVRELESKVKASTTSLTTVLPTAPLTAHPPAPQRAPEEPILALDQSGILTISDEEEEEEEDDDDMFAPGGDYCAGEPWE